MKQSHPILAVGAARRSAVRRGPMRCGNTVRCGVLCGAVPCAGVWWCAVRPAVPACFRRLRRPLVVIFVCVPFSIFGLRYFQHTLSALRSAIEFWSALFSPILVCVTFSNFGLRYV